MPSICWRASISAPLKTAPAPPESIVWAWTASLDLARLSSSKFSRTIMTFRFLAWCSYLIPFLSQERWHLRNQNSEVLSPAIATTERWTPLLVLMGSSGCAPPNNPQHSINFYSDQMGSSSSRASPVLALQARITPCFGSSRSTAHLTRTSTRANRS
ncbi:hypothetical protein D3C78_1289600 [compost metagenome]